MRLLEHPLYQKEIAAVAELPLNWDSLRGKRFVISGATGMIGHFLIDVLMHQNAAADLQCRIYALGRNAEKAHSFFQEYWENQSFQFVPWNFWDVPYLKPVDYVLHLASTTHPRAYASQPIDTILLNVQGLGNLLEAACRSETKRFLFASSCEIYGDPIDDTPFTEQSCGYIDCNTLRAGYPEGKRTGEALCQAYLAQEGLDVVIPRFSRTYGPTMLPSDTKAISQFIKKGVAREDIVLKSEGKQIYSYSHVADAVSGLLYCLLSGKKGEAYNIASGSIRMKELAQAAADCVGSRVVFQLPEAVEKSGYSVVKRSIQDTAKLELLGWKPMYPIDQGIRETVEILTDVWKGNEVADEENPSAPVPHISQ